MKDRDGLTTSPHAEDAGLTQTLRVLSAQTTTRSLDGDSMADKHALLICPDKSSEKWGPRWLGQSGFRCRIIGDPAVAVATVCDLDPDVVVVEAGVTAPDGMPVYRHIREVLDCGIPVFVLCGTAQEVAEAIDADVYDVSRKPFDWQLLARRARRVVLQKRRQEDLEETRESLKSALNVANRARRQLRHTETFESVTGLPNRTVFIDLVARGIRASQRDGNSLGVFVVGFNRFELLVEALGRHEANAVISEIGKRLNGCVRKAIDANPALRGFKTAAVGNIGTGRFGIMLTCSPDRLEERALRDEITAAMAEPATAAGQTIYISTTIGAALAPLDTVDAERLLIKAESTMRNARSRGVAFRYFSKEMDAAANRRLEVEQMLHRALAQRELDVFYQPINDVVTDSVVAVEALLRWPQADGSYITPDEFVPIAEDAGLMVKIGEFVIDEACRQLRTWDDAGMGPIRIAVNVARSQLMDTEFPDTVLRCLRQHEIDPGRLDLELSERGVMSGSTEVLDRIRALKRLGVTISLDDFGTGESSIAYLKDMPVDTLKIDRSYVATLPSEGRESRMVAAIIALARQLDLTVVAEGVETRPQLNILLSLGCDQYQGFLRSPAIAASELLTLTQQKTD